jgi:hypothetical protein
MTQDASPTTPTDTPKSSYTTDMNTSNKRAAIKATLWITGLIFAIWALFVVVPQIATLYPNPSDGGVIWVIFYMLWILISQALPGVVIIPFVSIPLWSMLFVGIFRLIKSSTALSKRFYSYIAAGVILPVIISLIGALFFDTDSKLALNVVAGVLGLNLLLLCYGIYQEKNHRLLTLACGGLLLTWSLFTAFVTGMSIVNDWI